MTHANQQEPPERVTPLPRSWPKSPRFLIGQDHRGNWVVQDRTGRCGGLFVNRVEALRFAMHEYDGGPRAAITVAGTLELAVGGRPTSPLPRTGEHRLSDAREPAPISRSMSAR